DGMEFMPEEFLQVWGYDQTVRWDQCVFFEGGILKCAINDSPFTTDDKETVYASKGWAIWVCSMPMVENPQSRQSHNYIFSGTHSLVQYKMSLSGERDSNTR
ncbi:MAG TPA: hypothetical protein VF753_06830, partial [Terriglobales bacterium]